VLFASMCVIWGLPYLMIRVAVRDLTPATVVFARTAVAALLLLPVALWRGSLPQLRGHWLWLLAFTMVELTVPWYLLTSAEQHLTSSMTGLLVAAVPLVSVVLARLAGSTEPVTARRLTGLLIGVAGVAALVGLQIGDISLLAVLQVLAVAVCYAGGPLIQSRHLSDLPSVPVVAVALTITAVVYAPLALSSHPHDVPAKAVWSVMGLAVICTALAFLVFFALIAEIGPVRSTVITYINPAVAIALGVVVLNEDLTTGMIVGFPLVIVGSVLATSFETPSTGPHPVTEPVVATPG
jgi:drug/metabolite transporter (DMT)-like permease